MYGLENQDNESELAQLSKKLFTAGALSLLAAVALSPTKVEEYTNPVFSTLGGTLISIGLLLKLLDKCCSCYEQYEQGEASLLPASQTSPSPV
jgi:hypothetical protein